MRKKCKLSSGVLVEVEKLKTKRYSTPSLSKLNIWGSYPQSNKSRKIFPPPSFSAYLYTNKDLVKKNFPKDFQCSGKLELLNGESELNGYEMVSQFPN